MTDMKWEKKSPERENDVWWLIVDDKIFCKVKDVTQYESNCYFKVICFDTEFLIGNHTTLEGAKKAAELFVKQKLANYPIYVEWIELNLKIKSVDTLDSFVRVFSSKCFS